EKMSKSLGNYIGVTEPASDMFGKIMSIPDSLMPNYYELLTQVPMDRVREMVNPSRRNPRDAKVALAKEIIRDFHGAEAADAAEQEFFRIHGGGQGGLPDDIPDHVLSADLIRDGQVSAADLVVDCGFAVSKGEARRLIKEKGIRVDGDALEDPMGSVAVRSGQIVQRGKRKYVRLVIS
ncbi:MAG: tyrosine--tRNA ligase, partial [Phycisphaerae bacterium]|nr:tyrosine--tRNA ligase [Phycisphaerae bacterium]